VAQLTLTTLVLTLAILFGLPDNLHELLPIDAQSANPLNSPPEASARRRMPAIHAAFSHFTLSIV
jgi:hypothetical protein